MASIDWTATTKNPSRASRYKCKLLERRERKPTPTIQSWTLKETSRMPSDNSKKCSKIWPESKTKKWLLTPRIRFFVPSSLTHKTENRRNCSLLELRSWEMALRHRLQVSTFRQATSSLPMRANKKQPPSSNRALTLLRKCNSMRRRPLNYLHKKTIKTRLRKIQTHQKLYLTLHHLSKITTNR